MLNTNCYERVNSSIYVLTRGKCICKSMFFQEKKFHSLRNIPSQWCQKSFKSDNKFTHMRSCVRKKKCIGVLCLYPICAFVC